MSLKKSVVSAEVAAAKAKAGLDAAESKLTLVDGEGVLDENPAKMKSIKSNVEKKEEEIAACDSLEAKEALLAQALDEIEVINIYCELSLSLSLYRLQFLMVFHIILYSMTLKCEDNEAFGVISVCL